MTTTTTRLIVLRCTNGLSKSYGKEIATVECDVSRETIAATVSAWCGRCREYHRQVIRVG